jgi:tetratricopeptide (TPR) repeat protein
MGHKPRSIWKVLATLPVALSLLVHSAAANGEDGEDLTRARAAQAAHARGDLEAAIRLYGEAIRFDDLSQSTLVAVYINRGLVWRDKQEHDRAIENYNEALKLNPKSDAAFANRGLAWSDKNQFDRAIEDYTEA